MRSIGWPHWLVALSLSATAHAAVLVSWPQPTIVTPASATIIVNVAALGAGQIADARSPNAPLAQRSPPELNDLTPAHPVASEMPTEATSALPTPATIIQSSDTQAYPADTEAITPAPREVHADPPVSPPALVTASTVSPTASQATMDTRVTPTLAPLETPSAHPDSAVTADPPPSVSPPAPSVKPAEPVASDDVRPPVTKARPVRPPVKALAPKAKSAPRPAPQNKKKQVKRTRPKAADPRRATPKPKKAPKKTTAKQVPAKPVTPRPRRSRAVAEKPKGAIPPSAPKAGSASTKTHRPAAPTSESSSRSTARSAVSGSSPAQPSRGARSAAKKRYLAHVRATIAKKQRYPARAKRRRIEGIVNVRFTIQRDGQVIDVRIEKSAKDKTLDNATLALIRSAGPFPPLPAALANKPLDVVLPIRYRLK
ncbi:MAG: TonB family protein [Pseudomonadota bacterium]